MSLTPADIEHVTFKRELRGYAEQEVDVFLDRVHARLSEVLAERDRLAERVSAAEQRATESSEADALLKRTLVLAQRTADDAIEEARQAADRALEEARARAEELVRDAEAEAARITADARRRAAQELEAARSAAEGTARAAAELQRFRADYRQRVHAAIAEQLAVLEGAGEIPEVPDELVERARGASADTAAAQQRLQGSAATGGAPATVVVPDEVAESVPALARHAQPVLDDAIGG